MLTLTRPHQPLHRNSSMINNPVPILVDSIVHSLVSGRGFSYGAPYVTSDGFALFTNDNHVIMANLSSIKSSRAASKPYFTNDGYVLVIDNNNILLGA